MKRFILLLVVPCFAASPWMLEQIDSQLGNGFIDRKDIKGSYERIESSFYGEYAPVALVRFANGQCHWNVPEKCGLVHRKKAQAFADAVEKIHADWGLPDFLLLLSLDACFERPYHLHLSNVLVFSVSKTERNKRVLLFPRRIFESERSQKYRDLVTFRKPLENRRPKLLWRFNTFDRAEIEYNFRLSPVIPLLFLAKKNSELLDFGIPKSRLRFVSNKITGHLSCMYKPDLSTKDVADYRYQLAFDYRASPSDLEDQLFAGAIILRARTPFCEWFTCQLNPYEHYVPIDARCDQIFQALDFCNSNEQQASQIAQNAQEFADKELSDQQASRYFYQLICRYAARLRGEDV